MWEAREERSWADVTESTDWKWGWHWGLMTLFGPLGPVWQVLLRTHLILFKLINSISTLGQSGLGFLPCASTHFLKDLLCLIQEKGDLVHKHQHNLASLLTMLCVLKTSFFTIPSPSPSLSFWTFHGPQAGSHDKYSQFLVPLYYSSYHNCNWIKNGRISYMISLSGWNVKFVRTK